MGHARVARRDVGHFRASNAHDSMWGTMASDKISPRLPAGAPTHASAHVVGHAQVPRSQSAATQKTANKLPQRAADRSALKDSMSKDAGAGDEQGLGHEHPGHTPHTPIAQALSAPKGQKPTLLSAPQQAAYQAARRQAAQMALRLDRRGVDEQAQVWRALTKIFE